MTEIEAKDIQFFMMIPVFITDNFYRMLDPDEQVDLEYAAQMQKQDSNIGVRQIPEMHQPLFITEDFKATFRPTALELLHVNAEQGVQAVIPGMNFVVRLKWRFEMMCNFGLLVLEIDAPHYTSMKQLNELIDIVQHDAFTWRYDEGWLLPHESITAMLDIPANVPVGLAQLVNAFSKLLNLRPVIKSQNPFVTFLLQMDIKGGNDFHDTTVGFGEHLLEQRFNYLSALFGYHEEQSFFHGTNWRCSQNLEMCSWFEWQAPLHRESPMIQHRQAPENIYTSSQQRRRAARRIFKICTMDYTVARTMAHLLASKGEARILRKSIHDFCKNGDRHSALYHDLLGKLARLESRFILLSSNITNPDWVLENPFGEGNRFVQLMEYISQAYGIQTHVNSLRQQLNQFNQMLNRCL